MKTSPKLIIATALCGLLLALTAASATAQSPAIDGYDETGISTIPPPDSPSAGPPSAPIGAPPGHATSGRLAFTGLDVPLLALLGGALIGAGALTRRRLASPPS